MDGALILVGLFIILAIAIVILLVINIAMGFSVMNRPNDYKYYLLRVDEKGEMKMKRYTPERGGIYHRQF